MANDTFNRPDGPLKQDETGKSYRAGGTWLISGGKARVQEVDTTRYLLVNTGETDVDISCDIFLEQSLENASAGLVFRARDTANASRFLLTAEQDTVRLRWDRIEDGRRGGETSQVIKTLKRGFALRLRCRGSRVEFHLDGQLVREAQLEPQEDGTLFGVLNGGGMPSWFDNIDIREEQ